MKVSLMVKAMWCVLGLALLVAKPSPVSAADVTLTLRHFLPPDSPLFERTIKAWGDTVEVHSGGQIKIVYESSLELGYAPPALYDQVSNGSVDLAWTMLSFTPGRFPRSMVFELPFMASSAEATSKAFHEFAETKAKGEFSGVQPIAFHTQGPFLLRFSSGFVENLEDLRNFTFGGPSNVSNLFLEHLGATTVGMSANAVPQALVDGTIVGFASPSANLLPARVPNLSRIHVGFQGDRGIFTTTFVLAMNSDSYERLPNKLRRIIDDNSGVEIAGMLGRQIDDEGEARKQELLRNGGKFLTFDSTETTRWVAASKRFIDIWVGQTNAQGHDGMDLLRSARSLIDSHRTTQ